MDGLSKFLNIAAAAILLAIVSLLLAWVCCNVIYKQQPTLPTSVTFVVEPTRISNKDTSHLYLNKKLLVDLNKFKDTLQLQIETLNKTKTEIEQSEQRNSDYFKLILSLIGAVFAIVGFFGFKSINDTRENAIKAAVSSAEKEAQRKAEEVAKIEVAKIDIGVKTDISTLTVEMTDILVRIEELEDNRNNEVAGAEDEQEDAELE